MKMNELFAKWIDRQIRSDASTEVEDERGEVVGEFAINMFANNLPDKRATTVVFDDGSECVVVVAPK